MSQHYNFQSKTGSYQIECRGNIVICTISGATSVDMANRYYEDLEVIAKKFSPQPWAYLGYAINHEAAVPEAESILRNAYLTCMQYNCISDAYCMKSAMAIAQLDKIRQDCRIPMPIEQRLFAELNGAIETLEKELDKCSKHSASKLR